MKKYEYELRSKLLLDIQLAYTKIYGSNSVFLIPICLNDGIEGVSFKDLNKIRRKNLRFVNLN